MTLLENLSGVVHSGYRHMHEFRLISDVGLELTNIDADETR
jgi:hypothetical protein